MERGLASFVEVGTALMRIRDEELYRESGYDGFVDYLESKSWGLHPSRAYQLIDSASVSTTVEIANEAQARELAPLLKKSTPEVAQRVYAEVVAETNGKPTAAAIRDKVQATLKPTTRRETPPDRPAQYLPDLLDEDSPRNLRTQIVKWCELGRHIESLLDDGARLEPKDENDLDLIRGEAQAMAQLCKRLTRRV